jgi:hypothetical protein
MTEPQTITTDHVRALLDADDEATVLGLIGGGIEVIAADRADEQGALEVISRDELVERLGSDPSDEDLSEQAAALSAAVQHLGG